MWLLAWGLHRLPSIPGSEQSVGAHAKGTVMGRVAGDKRSGRCALLRRPPSGLTGLAHSPWEGRGKAD